MPRTQQDCASWTVDSFSTDDEMCLAGADASIAGPGALIRGGAFDSGSDGGPLAIRNFPPQRPSVGIGFRGAR